MKAQSAPRQSDKTPSQRLLQVIGMDIDNFFLWYFDISIFDMLIPRGSTIGWGPCHMKWRSYFESLLPLPLGPKLIKK